MNESRVIPKMKAEILQAAILSNDASAVIGATLDAARIIINRKPLEPEGPVSGDELADLLNAALSRAENTVRLEFDDSSYCEMFASSEASDGQVGIYFEFGGRGVPAPTSKQVRP